MKAPVIGLFGGNGNYASGVSHTGSRSVYVTATGTSNWFGGFASPSITINPAVTYQFFGYIYVPQLTSKGSDSGVKLTVTNSAGANIGYIDLYTVTSTTSGWVYFSKTIGPQGESNFPAGAAALTFYADWYGNGVDPNPNGAFYVDDVAISCSSPGCAPIDKTITSIAWRYFAVDATNPRGINPTTLLPRGWIGGNWFNFWDMGNVIDGTVAGYKNGFITTQTEYQTRINALLNELATMPLWPNDGSYNANKPYYSYYWNNGLLNASAGGWDAADTGRTLNGLAYLRRQDPSYASQIDNLLTGRLKPWIDYECTYKNWGMNIYARDVSIACQYFSYLNSSYDKTTWFNNFDSIWTSSNRFTDKYGNSLPKIGYTNLGPISYEILEKGPDYSRTIQYASDMKNWAQKRDAATGKDSLWGTEFHVLFTNGSTPFAWQYYEGYMNSSLGYQSWYVAFVGNYVIFENDSSLASTTSTLDVAYSLRYAFPADPWVNSVFPRYTQSNLASSYGYYDGVFEATNGIEYTISDPHNAVVLMSSLP